MSFIKLCKAALGSNKFNSRHNVEHYKSIYIGWVNDEEHDAKCCKQNVHVRIRIEMKSQVSNLLTQPNMNVSEHRMMEQ